MDRIKKGNMVQNKEVERTEVSDTVKLYYTYGMLQLIGAFSLLALILVLIWQIITHFFEGGFIVFIFIVFPIMGLCSLTQMSINNFIRAGKEMNVK